MTYAFDLNVFLQAALAEDIGSGDVTGNATFPADVQARFVFIAREECVVAGLIYLPELFKIVNPAVVITFAVKDGDKVAAKTVLATVSGPARSILAGERVALNLLQHLSSIATMTRRYVDAVTGTRAQIWDTRKTIPLMRHMQKYAVTCGGGVNHRMGLYDAVMIKDNHIAVAGGVRSAIEAARAHVPAGMKIQVECDTLTQLDEALPVGVDSVLLDNMDIATLSEAVKRAKAAGVWAEASGNVNLQTVRAIAETGVNAISVGKLTHSVTAIDIGLDSV